MTKQKIIQDVRKRLLELSSGVFTDEDLILWADNAQTEISQEFLSQDRIKSAVLTFTDGEADLPSDFLSFYHAENGFVWVNLEDFKRDVFSNMLARKENKVLIKPANTSSVVLWYFKKPKSFGLLSDTEEPELPSLLHEGIVLGTVSRAYEMMQEFEISNLYLQKYRAFVEMAKRSISHLEERGEVMQKFRDIKLF